MLGVQVQRSVHGAHMGGTGGLAVQQVQEVRGDGIIAGGELDAAARAAVVEPVAQHRAQRGDEPVGDFAGTDRGVRIRLRQHAAQHRHAAAHHVHWMRGGRQLLQHLAHRLRQAAQLAQPGPVGRQLRAVRQPAMDEQMRDLLVGALLGDLQDVVAAVVQVVAGLAHRAQGGIARHHARQGNGFLRLARRGTRIVHQLTAPTCPCRKRTARPASSRRRDSPDTGTDHRASASAAMHRAASRCAG